MTRKGEFTIRPAESDDRNAIVTLLGALQSHVEDANSELWRMTPAARANLPTQIESRLRSGVSCALVAEHRLEGIIGVIFGRIVTNNRYTPSRAGQVDQAFVHPAHRRAGIGSRLVSELCLFFETEGVEDISLRYVVGNREAADFWSALGFSPRIITSGTRLQVISERLAQLAEN
jgi:GNAT superfamily N-acetyltransferase